MKSEILIFYINILKRKHFNELNLFLNKTNLLYKQIIDCFQ